MGDPKTVLEGGVKYRDKKKWKSRWAVVSKLSPVADCLQIQLYRDSRDRCRGGPTKASLSLEQFLGVETGFVLDKESNTMALVCSELTVVLAFDSRELLIQWQVKIRANLAEEQQFLVQITHVPTRSKLPCGPARLHLRDHAFCLVSGVPPRLLGTWPIKELRRFGVVEGKFCFEGGSLCGRGEGLHVLLTNQCSELAQAMDLASKGKLAGKRKTLSRKNSVLETSTRMSLHKKNQQSGDKCSASQQRPLLSSGSESSTCDACSEILRCGDDCLVYASSSLGGGSSSVKASASCRIHYRWPSCLSRWGQSSTTTTTTSDVESMDTVSVTLSDFQGPSAISKYSGHGQSLSCLCDGSQSTWPFNNNHCSKCGRQLYGDLRSGCREQQHPSPENSNGGGFSPHWTMDSVLDERTSLCSSSGSGGSEYSVPRNYHLEALYDRPRSVQQRALNGCGDDSPNCEALCLCHEPLDWARSSTRGREFLLAAPTPQQQQHQRCGCWSRLSMSPSPVPGRRSAGASPNSSPKKTRRTNDSIEYDCGTKTESPYSNYAMPRSPHIKDMQQQQPPSVHQNGDCKTTAPAHPAEDYDVPKKFTDLLPDCDRALKAGPACSCGPPLEAKLLQGSFSSSQEPRQQQVCACQRVMLWAGSLVPCLQGPRAPECGWTWQRGNSSKGAVCSEPPKTAVVMANGGGVRHLLLRGASEEPANGLLLLQGAAARPRSSTVSYPLLSSRRKEDDDHCTNYANLQFPKAMDTGPNYANLEFSDEHLYENSDLVMSRVLADKNKPPLPPPRPNSRCGCGASRSQATTSGGGAAYEMMCYERNPEANGHEDYLVMQPLMGAANGEVVNATVREPSEREKGDERTGTLPLRPFMPFSYPNPERNGQRRTVEELRSTRSNSFGEIKKRSPLQQQSTAARKRSCSVDGKGDSAVVIQRNRSLLSRLNLRSSEKSASANGIIAPKEEEAGTIGLHHRSAECLGEEHSDDDNSVSSAMRRSSSVPCRAIDATETAEERLNDLNKGGPENCKEQKDAVPGNWRTREVTREGGVVEPNCDNDGACERKRPDGCCDAVAEMRGVPRKNHDDKNRDDETNFRSSSRSSSSDISDYMESLSFISRSSSSSSGSAANEDHHPCVARTPFAAAPRLKPCGAVSVPSVCNGRVQSPVSSRRLLERDEAHPRLPDRPSSSSSSLSESPSVTDYGSSSSSSSSAPPPRQCSKRPEEGATGRQQNGGAFPCPL